MKTKSKKRYTKRLTKKRTFKKNKCNRKRSFKKLKMKGGMVFDRSDEGCAFWPSIIPGAGEEPNNTVTKIFFTADRTSNYNKEVAKYGLFDMYDPEFFYHPRLLSNGTCSTAILIDYPTCVKQYGSKIFDTNYINTEYVGKPLPLPFLTSIQFKRQLVDFYNNVLQLHKQEGQHKTYLIHPENHGGNVCYTTGPDNVYIFKYIDLGAIEEINGTEPISDGRIIKNINSQFLNIISALGIPYQRITQFNKGNTYEQYVTEILYVLNNYEFEEPIVAAAATASPENKKKGKFSFSEKDFSPKKGPSLFGSDSDSDSD